jgi:hypothetical protein
MEQPPDRAALLARIIAGESDLGQLTADLRRLPWDSPELVVLRAKDVALLLRRYLADEITAAFCSEWAETLECRDDVGFESSHEEELRDLLFLLANPAINEPLTPDRARGWLAQLGPTG